MNNSYTGWTLLDEVTLVIKKENDNYGGYEYSKAYLVNPKDKKQLERAISWGTYNKYEYTEEDGQKKLVYDEAGHTKYTTVKPDIITVKNEGFTVEFLDSAGNSCQGGKLSFWNCLVSKDDLKFVIGIDSHLLLYAMKQSTFIKGKSEEKFSFARCSGGVGILHSDMKEYQDAIRDMQTKKTQNTGKTTKWQLGRNYTTLTIDELFIAELYKVIDIKYEFSRSVYGRYAHIERVKENTKKIIVTDTKNFHNTYKSFKEYINKSKLKLNKVSLNDKDWNSQLQDVMHEILKDYGQLDKKPSRKQGDVVIETYDNYYSDLQSLIDNIKLKVIDKIEHDGKKIYPREFGYLFINTENKVSDLDKKLLDCLIHYAKSDYKIVLSDEVKEEFEIVDWR